MLFFYYNIEMLMDVGEGMPISGFVQLYGTEHKNYVCRFTCTHCMSMDIGGHLVIFHHLQG